MKAQIFKSVLVLVTVLAGSSAFAKETLNLSQALNQASQEKETAARDYNGQEQVRAARREVYQNGETITIDLRDGAELARK